MPANTRSTRSGTTLCEPQPPASREGAEGALPYNMAPESKSNAKDEIKDRSIRFFIAVYKPSTGYFYHWAFAMFNSMASKWAVYEVTRKASSKGFRAICLPADPTKCAWLECLVPLGKVDAAKLAVVRSVITSVPVPGGRPTEKWYEYAIDISSSLDRAGCIDADVLARATEAVQTYRGKQEEDFGACRARRPKIQSEEFVYDTDSENTEVTR